MGFNWNVESIWRLWRDQRKVGERPPAGVSGKRWEGVRERWDGLAVPRSAGTVRPWPTRGCVEIRSCDPPQDRSGPLRMVIVAGGHGHWPLKVLELRSRFLSSKRTGTASRPVQGVGPGPALLGCLRTRHLFGRHFFSMRARVILSHLLSQINPTIWSIFNYSYQLY